MKKATLICDLQFGSTGKGLIAGYLAERNLPDTLVTNWMPNAGHTYIDGAGRKFVHRALANGIVSKNLQRVMVAPGSVLDFERLLTELHEVRDLVGPDVYIYIHENAAVLMPRHSAQELSGPNLKIGSTCKGAGAALMEKITRDPDLSSTVGQLGIANKASPSADPGYRYINRWLSTTYPDLWSETDTRRLPQIRVIDTHHWVDILSRAARTVQIEGAQGFSLGINSGIYPYCTSRECTPAQILSDCLLPTNFPYTVVGCARTYPIRVANRHDDNGNMIGTSGPGYADQKELGWTDLGIDPELTTVTQLPRRIFSFSMQQYREALTVCQPDEVFLNFANYLDADELAVLLSNMGREAETLRGLSAGFIRYLGHGPRATDVQDVSDRETV